jgi:hypothetical protein
LAKFRPVDVVVFVPHHRSDDLQQSVEEELGALCARRQQFHALPWRIGLAV